MNNVGTRDRIIRIVLGIAVLASMFLPPFGLWEYVKLVIAALLIGTALFRFCPAYTLFGLKTK
jgi:hypothetical protein